MIMAMASPVAVALLACAQNKKPTRYEWVDSLWLLR
jgi:hypothetical protein